MAFRVFPRLLYTRPVRTFFTTAGIACLLSLFSMCLGDMLLHDRIALLGSFAGLLLTHNPGIAFGVRLPPVVQELVIIAALAWMTVLALRSSTSFLHRLGFGFIVGGALGNLLDRLLDGVVTDYFQVGTFPIFNVADSFITIGVLFLLADALGMVRHTQR